MKKTLSKSPILCKIIFICGQTWMILVVPDHCNKANTKRKTSFVVSQCILKYVCTILQSIKCTTSLTMHMPKLKYTLLLKIAKDHLSILEK